MPGFIDVLPACAAPSACNLPSATSNWRGGADLEGGK